MPDQTSPFTILFILALAAILFAIFQKSKQRKIKPDPKEPKPYSVYTDAYDIEGHASAIINKIDEISPDAAYHWAGESSAKWEEAIDAAQRIFDTQTEERTKFLNAIAAIKGGFLASDCAVVFLLDQSGSMKGAPIVHAAAALRSVTECLGQVGITTELLGFSTAGWHGGFVREKWVQDGRPAYPGRLCALLHLIYKSADEATMAADNWQAMLHPDILRENVDGEALQWAYSRVRTLPQKHKILVVLSDGAPVDDSTLMENGPSILVSHLEQTIGALSGESGLQLAGFGIHHRVEEYYPTSSHAEIAAEIYPKLSTFVLQQLREGRAEAPPQP